MFVAIYLAPCCTAMLSCSHLSMTSLWWRWRAII